jgi:type IV pilus assembly protein PilA
MDKSRLQAEEIAAIQTLKSIQNAEVQYSAQYGAYAKSLSQLGPAASGQSSAQAADLIPADVAGGTKGGYKFTLDGDGQKFSVQARPVTYGQTGNRSFYSDASLVIHQNNDDAPATAQSPELK